jgi:hypothetical protein
MKFSICELYLGWAGLKAAAAAASGHILFECSICIVSSRLLLGRTFKCTSILALCPEMSENICVSRAFSSFMHMCRGAFWVAVIMTRLFFRRMHFTVGRLKDKEGKFKTVIVAVV